MTMIEKNNDVDTIDVPIDNLTRFKNEHLSVSRLERYEQCPSSFKLRYIDHVDKIEDKDSPATFGSLLHDVMQKLYEWIRDEEYSGPFPVDKVTEFFRTVWNTREMVSLALYQEGLKILRDYAHQQAPVNHFTILGVEVPFDITIEEFIVNGRIDRVDRVNTDTVKIIDYKSNRLLYSAEQLEANLQMSVYALAVKRKWEWIKNIEYEFHMLRHGITMTTKRTALQLSDAQDYIVYLGRRTENDEKYKPNLNPNCGFCDVRHRCQTFIEATNLTVGDVGPAANDTSSLETISEDRERVAALAKIFYKRKEQMEDLLRVHMEKTGTLEVNGYFYSLVSWNYDTQYPMDTFLRVVSRIIGHSPEETLRDVCLIDKKRVEFFLDRMEEIYPRGKVALLRAELEAIQVRVPGKPKFNSKRTKEAKPIDLPGPNQIQAVARKSSRSSRKVENIDD